MKSYGQFCPVAKAAEIFCERWTALILRDLTLGSTRFSQLQRGVPLMSPTLLSRRLKQLEAEGVVERRPARRGATYHLTPSGKEFAPLVHALGVWGRRWTRRRLEAGEVDLGLLLWALESGVRPDAFGRARSVVRLHLTDQGEGRDEWWYVNKPEGCELCLEDPGYDVDLHLFATLPDMIHVIRGDLSLGGALDSGRLEAHGASKFRRQLKAWLNLGPLTTVPSMVEDAPA